jgi:transposase-like protein
MERKERRHHTREFKLEAVRLAAVGDKTKAKVARELSVRVKQLRQWRDEQPAHGHFGQRIALLCSHWLMLVGQH